ncbi:7-carboxy-7-deazaguanine synthase QueE [Taibaiella helva]|uniref:7-carboxy-7-deazaguanine synthase QueE n=1 Tax=Taibaiella helva TaxID=2301235 RepID=UPI001E33524E|nr:7-carboxy-7-deazaguanine synthase QueE [Taibaiella helva]
MMKTAEATTVSYPVMEHFYTLQGEGFYSGQAAYFIRLGGCDVGCVWCDVKESWDAAAHPLMSTETMAELAGAHPGKIVVVTGGEPSMYDLVPITQTLKAAGLRTHVETSASSPLTGDWDWVTLSPKKFKAPLPGNLPLADELKVVVFNKSDFKWAEEFAAQVKPGCKLYLQPEWDKREAMTPLIIDYIQQHPQWQLSLQTHKYLNIP